MTDMIKGRWGSPRLPGRLIKSLLLCCALTLFPPVLLTAITDNIGVAYADHKENSDGADSKNNNDSKNKNESKKKYQNVKVKKRQAVGKKCATKLESVQQLFGGDAPPNRENLQSLVSQLQGYLTSGCTTSYEKSQVYNLLGFVHYSLDDYQKATQNYRLMVAEPDVDERQKVDTHYTLGQLYMALEDYKNAAIQLELWMENSAVVSGDGQVLLAQAYYQLGHKQASLKLVNKAIDAIEAKGNVPKEGWWLLQKILYFERADQKKSANKKNNDVNKNYKKVIAILKQLIQHYPDHRYWYELGGIYGQMEDNKQRLAALDILYLDKALTKSRDLLSLAYLYLGAGVPNKAAQIIEQGIAQNVIGSSTKNLEILGAAWQQAKETNKALAPLSQAAKHSDTGEIWSRLAMVYLDKDDNFNAVSAARKALKKGGLKNPSYTQMTLGNALANLHCYRDAINVFNEASSHKKSKAAARQWLAYARGEAARRESLIESGANISGCQLP